jgi:putative tryptophan/tyrosine transport system substrate-binding protein
MNKTIVVYLAAALILISAQFSEAQQAGKLYRIGVLSPNSVAIFSKSADGLHQGLRELGYVEGQNLAIEYRYADGKLDRLPELAAELVQLKVNIIVASSSPAAAAARDATKEIPIIFSTTGDAVANGLVASLARPGGNVTGVDGSQ